MKPHTPAQLSRSSKPAPLKSEVWARHALRESNSKIARDLGISRNTVTKIIAERQPVQADAANEAQRALARHGITLDTVAQKLREGMEATEVKLATWEGRFSDRVEVPDHSARFRYTEASGKMLEMFPKDETNIQSALLIRIGNTELVPGHADFCQCRACCDAWNELGKASLPASAPLPDE